MNNRKIRITLAIVVPVVVIIAVGILSSCTPQPGYDGGAPSYWTPTPVVPTMTRLHDPSKQVTCWVFSTGGGSCLPDVAFGE